MKSTLQTLYFGAVLAASVSSSPLFAAANPTFPGFSNGPSPTFTPTMTVTPGLSVAPCTSSSPKMVTAGKDQVLASGSFITVPVDLTVSASLSGVNIVTKGGGKVQVALYKRNTQALWPNMFGTDLVLKSEEVTVAKGAVSVDFDTTLVPKGYYVLAIRAVAAPLTFPTGVCGPSGAKTGTGVLAARLPATTYTGSSGRGNICYDFSVKACK